MPYFKKNNSGIILLSVLWIIAILSVMALTLSRASSVEVAMTKFSIGKLRASLAAHAGAAYVRDLLLPNEDEMEVQEVNSFYQCGLSLKDNQSPQDVLKGVRVGSDGFFDIGFWQEDEKERTWVYALRDEDRKVNLNAITQANFRVLEFLIISLGFDQETAKTVASCVVDWKDEDQLVTSEPYGAEDDEYLSSASQPHKAKNRPFEHVEELFFLKGMTPKLYYQLKDFVTVYPSKEEGLLVNLNTASLEVLKAMAEYLIDVTSGLKVNNSDSFAQKLDRYRLGEDGVAYTADDRIFPKEGNYAEEMGLSLEEEHLYTRMVQNHHRESSGYFDILVRGSDEKYGVDSYLEAVIKKEDGAVLRWRRQ